MQISEVRPEELPQVRQLFEDGALPSNLASPLGLSLVARDGEAIVAAIVCVREADGYACRHAVAPQFSDPELPRLLVDKALLKLHSHGIYKCRIQMDEAFFGNVRWMNETESRTDVIDSAATPDTSAAPASSETLAEARTATATLDPPAVAREQRSPADSPAAAE